MSIVDTEKVGSPSNHGHVFAIPIVIDVIIGSAKMTIAELMDLGSGAVIPLDRKIDEPVEISVNGRIIAKGQIVMLDDEPAQIGVSILEIA